MVPLDTQQRQIYFMEEEKKKLQTSPQITPKENTKKKKLKK